VTDPQTPPAAACRPVPAPRSPVEASREWRRGPLRLRFLPAEHPTADIEVAAAVVGFLILAGLLFLPLGSLAALTPGCRFHEFTGWPCATCGVTRGLVALGAGHWREALRCNPLLVGGFFVFLAYAALAALLWLFRLPRPRLELASRGARLTLLLAVVAAVLANWAFLIADGR
jgi:hypothetical protein